MAFVLCKNFMFERRAVQMSIGCKLEGSAVLLVVALECLVFDAGACIPLYLWRL